MDDLNKGAGARMTSCDADATGKALKGDPPKAS
ncbi:MAG: PsiF family protein [Pseudomonas sp.]